ncbi:MAG: hypothetical protein PHR06_10260 [Candidatus Cloacimonetes bacterium]|nr:hypothetical protein [Candidatus Cloacimonadota bacterium]
MSSLDLAGIIITLVVIVSLLLSIQTFMQKGNIRSFEENAAFREINACREIFKNELRLIGLKSQGIESINDSMIVYYTKKTFDSDASSIDLTNDPEKKVTIKYDKNAKGLKRKIDSGNFENPYFFKDVESFKFSYYSKSGNITAIPDSVRFIDFQIVVSYEDPSLEESNFRGFLTIQERFLLKNLVQW